MLKVITVTDQPERAKPLLDSLTKHGWDFALIQLPKWHGFGTKLIFTHAYLKDNPEVTEFIFCDAHDVICLGGPGEFEKLMVDFEMKMLVSTEKGCWPIGQNHVFFEKHEHGFNFINSGLYYAKSEYFIALFERYRPDYEFDDQIWMQSCFLKDDYVDMALDSRQHLFNSHSFIAVGEYTYENNRVQILGNQPLFIHFNGGTVDEKFNEMIKL